MGLSTLRNFLKKHQRIALDTSIFIYHVEANPLFGEIAHNVFSWLERAPHTGVASTIGMSEVLVHPYRDGDEALVDKYFALLSSFPNLEWVPPDLTIADKAAQIRAQYGLRTPDALHLATGVCQGATAILTNDAAWSRVGEIEVGVLDQLKA